MIGSRLFSPATAIAAAAIAFALFFASTRVEAAERVVSIDGSVTEIIYALGEQRRLVGVDTTSRYPAEATKLPQVGYMRQLSVEGILSLQPELVLASADAGPASVFEQLQQAGVQVVRTQSDYSLDGVLAKVDTVAKALGIPASGNAIKQRIEQRTLRALARIPDSKAPATLFLLGAGHRGLMAAGSDTQAAAMLQMVNASNAMHFSGYKPLSAEGAIAAAPEVVLVGSTRAGNGPNAEADPISDTLATTLKMTPATQANRVHDVDISLMLGFGPRLPEAVEQLVDLIWYPETRTVSQN